MQIITAKHEVLRALKAKVGLAKGRRVFRTGLDALDRLACGGSFQCGAVHELLFESTAPKSLALVLAKAAQTDCGAIVWSDPAAELYPPALSAAGIDLRSLMVLRCKNRADELWALSECMRCAGVNATIGGVSHLSQLEARRLQLAAERGGGIGVLMRPYAQANGGYAAATRWLVEPAPGNANCQRWQVELLHGHGGLVGQSVLLELDRETRAMCASAAVADRSAASAPARATA
jgi:protein ImuA